MKGPEHHLLGIKWNGHSSNQSNDETTQAASGQSIIQYEEILTNHFCGKSNIPHGVKVKHWRL